MIRMKNDGYYVYIHRRIEDMCPIYIGKGCGMRAFDRESRNDQHKVGMAEEYYIDIVQSGLEEQAALQLEDDLIRIIGRKDLNKGPLLNLAGGKEDVPIINDDEENSLVESINEAMEYFREELIPFPYSKLSDQVGISYSILRRVLAKYGLEKDVVKSNEFIDKSLIRLAIENGCYTDGEISRHAGINLSERFKRRIKEVKEEDGEE